MAEGFADIWGTSIEQYALGLPEPLWYIGAVGRTTNNYSYINTPSLAHYGRGRICTYFHHALCVGREFSNPTYEYIEEFIEVCGIGTDDATRILVEAVLILEQQGGATSFPLPPNPQPDAPKLSSFNNYEDYLVAFESYIDNNYYPFKELKDVCLTAVDNLENEGYFNSLDIGRTDFIKAQINNAWGSMGVPRADFQVFTAESVEFCSGFDLELIASSEVGTISWSRVVNGNTENIDQYVNSAGTLNIPTVNEGDNGIYTVTVEYNYQVDGIPQVCTLSRDIEVEVKHVVFDLLAATPNNTIEMCLNATESIQIKTSEGVENLAIICPTGLACNLTDNTLEITANTADSGDCPNIQADCYLVEVSGECLNNNGDLITVTDEVWVDVQEAPNENLQVGIENPQTGDFEATNNVTICGGDEVILFIENTSGYNYEYCWTSDNIDCFPGQDIDFSPIETTIYTAIVSNACGSTQLSITVNVSGGDGTIDLGVPQDICKGEILQGPDGYDSYNWINNLGEEFNEKNIPINVEASSEAYTYTLHATIGECKATGSIELIVLEFPAQDIPNIDLLGAIECSPSNPLTLTESDNNVYQYWEWKQEGNPNVLSQGSGSANNLSVNTPGTYTLMVQSTVGGCEFESTHDVTYADIGIMGNIDVKPNEPLNDYWKPSSLTADNIITIEGTVTVKQGATLSIANGTIVEFIGTNSGIVVERGGRLEATNVTFQLSECQGNSTYWNGLQVNGDSYSDHPSNYLSDIANHPNHGLIDLNLCTIWEAKTGIKDYFFLSPWFKYMGGGIVDVWKCTFENNQTAIRLGRTYNGASTESKIIDCDFVNSANFAENIYFYYHVVLDGLADAPIIKKNLFQTSINAPLAVSDKGVGILILNSNFRIGTDCEEDANTFDNLFQGIDVYGIPNIQEKVISHNVFQGVQKGITLNTTEMADIIANDFDVPLGNPFPNDSYGILTNSSNDFTLRWNTFTTPSLIVPNAGNTRALVIRNSNVDVNGAEFRDNTFNGLYFQDAVRFEQNNEGVLPSCNSYVDCLADWHLAPDCQLTQIGELCGFNPGAEEILFNEQWHSVSVNGGWNILNESTNNLLVNHSNSGNAFSNAGVSLFDCNYSGPSPCLIDNTQPCLPQIALLNPDYNSIYSQILVQHTVKDALFNQNHLAIKNLLESENNTWANRVLVPYYLHQADTGKAQITLARIPNTTPLHDILSMLVNEINSNDEFNLLNFTTSHDSYTAALAESMLTLYFDGHYVRGVNEGSQSNKRSNLLKVGNPIQISNDVSLQLYPNPTKDYLQLVFTGNIKEVKANIRIYDLKGKEVFQSFLQQKNEIDISALKEGTYFCQISFGNIAPITEKLVIIR